MKIKRRIDADQFMLFYKMKSMFLLYFEIRMFCRWPYHRSYTSIFIHLSEWKCLECEFHFQNQNFIRPNNIKNVCEVLVSLIIIIRFVSVRIEKCFSCHLNESDMMVRAIFKFGFGPNVVNILIYRWFRWELCVPRLKYFFHKIIRIFLFVVYNRYDLEGVCNVFTGMSNYRAIIRKENIFIYFTVNSSTSKLTCLPHIRVRI